MKCGEDFHRELQKKQIRLLCTDDKRQREEIRREAAQYATHKIRIWLAGGERI